MVSVYFDASALIKRYAPENGSELVNELFHQLPVQQMSCATIGILEIVATLVRKRNDGRLPSELFTQAMIELDREIIANKAFITTAISDRVALSALDLIAQYNINATDAIILRSCLTLHHALQNRGDHLILWSCDKRLLRAARSEGIDVFDPEAETWAQLQAVLTG